MRISGRCCGSSEPSKCPIYQEKEFSPLFSPHPAPPLLTRNQPTGAWKQGRTGKPPASLPTYFLFVRGYFSSNPKFGRFCSAVVFCSSSFSASGSPIKLQQHRFAGEHPGFFILNAGDGTLNLIPKRIRRGDKINRITLSFPATEFRCILSWLWGCNFCLVFLNLFQAGDPWFFDPKWWQREVSLRSSSLACRRRCCGNISYFIWASEEIPNQMEIEMFIFPFHLTFFFILTQFCSDFLGPTTK